jgi:phospholipid transport system transporter-binding protein
MTDETGAVATDFLPVDGNARWVGTGPLTFANAAAVLEATSTLPLPGDGIVDCSGITPVDSSAVAVLLALKRRAVEAAHPLTFSGLPPALKALVDVYDVEALLEAS